MHRNVIDAADFSLSVAQAVPDDNFALIFCHVMSRQCAERYGIKTGGIC